MASTVAAEGRVAPTALTLGEPRGERVDGGGSVENGTSWGQIQRARHFGRWRVAVAAVASVATLAGLCVSAQPVNAAPLASTASTTAIPAAAGTGTLSAG